MKVQQRIVINVVGDGDASAALKKMNLPSKLQQNAEVWLKRAAAPGTGGLEVLVETEETDDVLR